MKHLYLKYAWLPVLLLLAGCWKEPNYSKVPEIEFNSTRAEFIKNQINQVYPRIFIKLKFKDGDGNLGLDDEDINRAPFNDTLIIKGNDTIVNRTKSNNYFIKAFYNDNGTYVPFPNLTIQDGYRFMRLSPNNKSSALEGDLDYYFDVVVPIWLTFPNYKSGDSLRFEVYVTDRNFNKSNIVVTEPVAVFEP